MLMLAQIIEHPLSGGVVHIPTETPDNQLRIGRLLRPQVTACADQTDRRANLSIE
jgi:hypothetical protein